MTTPGDPADAKRAPDGPPLAALSQALARINGSLDFDTVLREVIEAACALTGAHHGCVTTVDGQGTHERLATSGLSEEQRRRLMERPGKPGLFEPLRDLPTLSGTPGLASPAGPFGVVGDVVPAGTCMGAPMHHLGAHVGTLLLGDKRGGGGFTNADGEVLQLFAAQAAAVIVNARAYRAEQRARADLEALVETAPIGVVVFDTRTGRPVSFNREATRMMEILGSPERAGEHLLAEMTCRFADGREMALDRSSLAGALRHAEQLRGAEVVVSTGDQRRITALVNASPVHREDGTVESVVVTAQDLAQVVTADRMRAEFLGMVSHELRTPLAAIKGLTTTLLGSAQSVAPAETRQFHRIIDQQADRISSLISDLLDADRIDAGALSVTAEPAEVGGLIEQARTAFLSGGGRHAVLIDLPTDLPRVMADRGRIVQVLNNLLANAARHSPAAAPIRITAERDGTDIAVTVTDEGRGITPERLARLFHKYGGDSDGAGNGGPADRDGLGLAISKGLVEAHGGRIRAESAGPGRGARFTFTLPLAGKPAARAGTAQRRCAPPQGTGAKPRILVVDNDPQALQFVRNALHEADYAPLVAGDHHALPRLIKKEKPDLVVLDLILPGTDGIGLMETVPGLADLPVIFMSGYGRDETVARALEAGAEDFIIKPFSPTEFTARIRAVLRRRAPPGPFVLGKLAVDYALRRVTLGGRVVNLTTTEYELLRVLALAGGRVVTHDALLRQVWAGRSYTDAKLVHAFVKRLRKKLGEAGLRPSYVFTERGVGYRMARADDVEQP